MVFSFEKHDQQIIIFGPEVYAFSQCIFGPLGANGGQRGQRGTTGDHGGPRGPRGTTGGNGGQRPRARNLAQTQTTPLPTPPGPLKLRLFGEISRSIPDWFQICLKIDPKLI